MVDRYVGDIDDQIANTEESWMHKAQVKINTKKIPSNILSCCWCVAWMDGIVQWLVSDYCTI